MIKCVATDMDGTLLDAKMQVSQENKKAIEAAQAQGVEVVVATGRSYFEARFALDEADIHCPVICINGAETRDPEGNIVEQAFLPVDQALEVYSMLKKAGLYFEIYTDQGTYTDDYEKALDIMVDIYLSGYTDLSPEQLREEAKKRFDIGLLYLVDSYEPVIREGKHSIYKFLAYSFDEEKLEKASGLLERIPELAISSSGSENIEITHTDAQKGTALERFIESKGIRLEETMAIGDNLNDLSMLQKAGVPVAMENANPQVKQVCSYVTDLNDESGVASAINRFILGKQVSSFHSPSLKQK
ncbi:Cof-type HAD-IIB family hydrolase [Bacillus thermotolerans]|uniref:Cof-type HAD-IIB family hydrolase n=1 Tax=Bacillus thermotolerans TaxID=1221996 RepID=UPI000591E8BF|nr:Cof-type HAD-IIB family hydrolase [Bacillus thermotolerans]KKB40130.1 Hydrolase (HAD superfamily) [Bacillus thermotolerans]